MKAQQYQRIYIVEKHFQCAVILSLTMRVYLYSFSRCCECCLKKTCDISQNSEKIVTYSSSRSSKVDDFGTNRKRISHFPLGINNNFGPAVHRFWDTATYWLKIAYCSYPSLIRRPRSLRSIPVKLIWRKLVMGLFCGERCMTHLPVWQRTDGWAIAYSAL